MHSVMSATRQHTESKATWWMGVPRGSIQRVPVRRAPKTTILLQAKHAKLPRAATKIYIIKHPCMDE
jgi:hypothetical protein